MAKQKFAYCNTSTKKYLLALAVIIVLGKFLSVGYIISRNTRDVELNVNASCIATTIACEPDSQAFAVDDSDQPCSCKDDAGAIKEMWEWKMNPFPTLYDGS